MEIISSRSWCHEELFLYVFISLFLFSLSSCKDDKDVVAVLELGLENADFIKKQALLLLM